MTATTLQFLSYEDRVALVQATEELRRRQACPFKTYFPETGPLRRSLYPRSMEFIAAGGLRRADGSYVYNERMFLAANRTSKTVTAAYETTAHLTGLYPRWWNGRRFSEPIDSWAAGDTHETTRDIIQNELLGPRLEIRQGTYAGMIPGHLVVDRTLKSGGTADCVDTVWVRHVERQHGAPCTSTLQFKAFNQGRLAFQGTKKHWIWIDEEPPDAAEDVAGGGTPSGNGDCYTECVLRTATTGGMVVATLTPLRGLTLFIDQWLSTAQMAAANGQLANAKQVMFGEAA